MERISPSGTPFTAGSTAPDITLDGTCTIPAMHGTMQLRAQYTPDQWVMTDDQFEQWLGKAENARPQTWEELATRMLEGFYDALLPRTVTLTIQVSGQGIRHTVVLTKAQPKR
ncbi:MAG: hypothetical protein WAX89_05175 [Alphaproteobacteria bacterium]